MADKKRTGISYDMLRLQLMERLKDNFADYMDDIRTLSVDDIAVWSHETASKAKAYHYLADATDLKRADIEYLLQFRDPLSIVADEFAWNIGIKSEAASLQDVFKKQSALQQGYELMPEQENMRTAGVVTVCVNGELRKGDLVLTTPENDYACLVGTVLAIEKAGTPDHHTDNEGDDIHVNFMEAEYSENRMLEIQDMLWDLDGRPTPPKPDVLPPLDVDDVIMAPDMLIRINGIGREELEEILDSGKNAAAYYERTVAAHVSGLSDKDKPLFEGRPAITKSGSLATGLTNITRILKTLCLEKARRRYSARQKKSPRWTTPGII